MILITILSVANIIVLDIQKITNSRIETSKKYPASRGRDQPVSHLGDVVGADKGAKPPRPAPSRHRTGTQNDHTPRGAAVKALELFGAEVTVSGRSRGCLIAPRWGGAGRMVEPHVGGSCCAISYVRTSIDISIVRCCPAVLYNRRG